MGAQSVFNGIKSQPYKGKIPGGDGSDGHNHGSVLKATELCASHGKMVRLMVRSPALIFCVPTHYN